MMRLAANLPLLLPKYMLLCWKSMLDITECTKTLKTFFEKQRLRKPTFDGHYGISVERRRLNNSAVGWNQSCSPKLPPVRFHT